MQDVVVNGELTITIPEGFKVLDSEGLKELYNDDNADRDSAICRYSKFSAAMFPVFLS